jgi:SAM-dependent methyltransferase
MTRFNPLLLLLWLGHSQGLSVSPAAACNADRLQAEKNKLLDLLQASPKEDPVLADPLTKEPLTISTTSPFLGGSRYTRQTFILQSASHTYSGKSDTFLDLLQPAGEEKSAESSFFKTVVPLIPPPLRSAMVSVGMNDGYIPMRDLFTSPSVSFAYERGWRQGFRAAGFPGPDQEAEMAMAYFAPSMAKSDDKVLVDMSCATGLFTRRFAASGKYKRVLGCDYSDSMLLEAGRRIRAEPSLLTSNSTKLELIRLDVGQIPMKDNSVDALHAGAAMHCWPDLDAAVSEIYRVLKPGGRYFATTFLSSYFGTLQRAEGGASGPSKQAFQYFGSVEELRTLLVCGGFKKESVTIEVLGNACVVIRCEK